jgi:hypothetical protein
MGGEVTYYTTAGGAEPVAGERAARALEIMNEMARFRAGHRGGMRPFHDGVYRTHANLIRYGGYNPSESQLAALEEMMAEYGRREVVEL